MAGDDAMRKLVLVCGTLAAMAVIGSANSSAEARDYGFHISGPGYHVDLGRPHARTAYFGSYYGGYDSCYPSRGVWHDTGHYDYHPGEYVRHRGHYHYEPGHYDYHSDGHWDHGW
jgi:hypothetical protein